MKIKIFTTLKYFVSTLLKTFPKYPLPILFSMHFSFIINTKSNFKKKKQHHMKIKTNIQNIIKKLKNIKINVKKTIKKMKIIYGTH